MLVLPIIYLRLLPLQFFGGCSWWHWQQRVPWGEQLLCRSVNLWNDGLGFAGCWTRCSQPVVQSEQIPHHSSGKISFFPSFFLFLSSSPPPLQKENSIFQPFGSRGSNNTLSALEIRRDEGTYTNIVWQSDLGPQLGLHGHAKADWSKLPVGLAGILLFYTNSEHLLRTGGLGQIFRLPRWVSKKAAVSLGRWWLIYRSLLYLPRKPTVSIVSRKMDPNWNV